MAIDSSMPSPEPLRFLGEDLYGPDGTANRKMTLMGGTIIPQPYLYQTPPPNFMNSYHLDPWHKLLFGWIEPRILNINELASPINLNSIGKSDITGSVILYDPSHGANEFFFLEYRTPNPMGSGAFDREVNSEGLAIWHVLTDANKRPLVKPWPPNTNTTFHTVYLEGMPQPNPPSAPPGPTGFTRAGYVAWQPGTVTPTLSWWDNSTTKLRLAVRWYPIGSLNILVDVYPERVDLPTSSQLVSPKSGSYQVFWSGRDGDLLVNSMNVFANRLWDAPAPLTSRGTILQRTEPTALARSNGQIDVFWIGADQAIWWMTRPSNREWSTPQQITPPAVADMSSRIRAVSRNFDHLDVFWANADGILFSTWMDNYADGGAWTNHLFQIAPTGSVKSPWSVFALAPGPNLLNVYWIRSDDTIWLTEWRPDANGRDSKWQASKSLASSAHHDTAIVGFCQDFQTFDVFWVDQFGRLRHGAQTPLTPWSEQAVAEYANVTAASDLALCYVSERELAVCYVLSSGALQAAIYSNSGSGWNFSHFDPLPQSSALKALPGYQLAAATQEFGHADLAFVQEDFSLHHASRASNGVWRTDIEIASGGLVRSKN